MERILPNTQEKSCSRSPSNMRSEGISRLRKKELTERLLHVFSPQPQLAPTLSFSPVLSVEQSQQTVASHDFDSSAVLDC